MEWQTEENDLQNNERTPLKQQAEPWPYDHVNTWQPDSNRSLTLSAYQKALVLSAFPMGSSIRHLSSIGDRTGPPIKVTVVTPKDQERVVLLRTSRLLTGVETETRVLSLLTQLGLPVPEVLAGPAYDPNEPNRGAFCVLGLLPGDNLQHLSWSSEVGVEQASRLVLEAVGRLHQLTGRLAQEATANLLQRCDLLTQLRLIVERGGLWLQQPLFWQAVRQLVPVLARINTPLVFSNGDYNPANFLSDGQQITGFIDFEMACFEDPHYGFAKYRVYDMIPFCKTGLVEQYLETHGLSEVEFAPRMAVRCLWTLQRELPVFEAHARPQNWADAFTSEISGTDSDDPQAGVAGYRRHVLKLLCQSLEKLP